MPVCVGCGSSYDNEFGFCPYCGRVKPEPTRIQIEIIPGTEKYEEGTLRLAYTGRKERQKADKVHRNMLHQWSDYNVEVYFFQLEIMSFSPTRGEYIPVISKEFRDFPIWYFQFIRERVEKPDARAISEWYDAFSKERLNAWRLFNQEMIKQNWIGITRQATERTTPDCLSSYTTVCDRFKIKNTYYYSLPEIRMVIDLANYRYKRVVSG